MNKNELALQMVKDSSITKSDALIVIDTLIEVITKELQKNDGKITLVGFGTLKTINKKKKKGRNPRTGEEIIIPKKKTVKFVPGKKLKELINK
ncbi:MAG: HU family DNA-binding protein [Candidatus Aminicenantes bacterium]|jgi:DNA-binding protein HU-beta|nr:HU family DNA-binding protein [Candidatus Aminicenantes bacterium]